MKEPYEEGIANRLGPASCAGDGNIAGVAGTGVHAGQVLNSEIIPSACRPCPVMGKATRRLMLFGEPTDAAAESETLCMCGTFQHGNRETSVIPCGELLPMGRSEKARCQPIRHVRHRGVGRSRSTWEAGEQSRNSGGGVRGGKGIDRGKSTSNDLEPDTVPDSSGYPFEARTASRSRYATDRHTQGRSRMR